MCSRSGSATGSSSASARGSGSGIVDGGNLTPPNIPYTPIDQSVGDPKWCKISVICRSKEEEHQPDFAMLVAVAEALAVVAAAVATVVVVVVVLAVVVLAVVLVLLPLMLIVLAAILVVSDAVVHAEVKFMLGILLLYSSA